MLAYLGDAEDARRDAGAEDAPDRSAGRARTASSCIPARWTCAAGCWSTARGCARRASRRSIEGYPAKLAPREFYAKGNYYSLTRRAPFSRLVYPVPEPGGLGVHVTLDLAGQARFGPDVEWVDRIDYGVDPKRAERFYAAIRRYWPGLPDGALAPGYSGIRPKTSGPGEPASDFEVQGPRRTASPAWCICSASSRPDSPRASPSLAWSLEELS